MQHLLARLSYAFFIFAAILGWDAYGAWSGHGRPLPPWRIGIEIVLAAGCLVFGTAGIRAKHMGVRGKEKTAEDAPPPAQEMAWVFDENELVYLGGEREQVFKVKDQREVGEMRVLIADVAPGQSLPENVFGVAKDNRVVWQIERVAQLAADPADRYTAFAAAGSGTVIVLTRSGNATEIEASTGKVLRMQTAK